MAIRIDRIGDRYTAVVSPPHGGGTAWETVRPVPIEDLIDQLTRRGCHQTDIGDALYDADPEWLLRLEQEADPDAG